MIVVRARPRHALAAVFALSAFLLSGCNDDIGDVYSPKEWRDLLNSAGGWTPLPIPDAKYREGSIILVNDDGIRWLGDLESCRYPDQFSKPAPIPAVTFSKSKVFSANVLAGYNGIELGPGFDRDNKVTLKVTDHSADALNLLALKVWQEDPVNRASVSSVCMDELAKSDRYLITEAFVASNATYTLYDKKGVKLDLNAPEWGSLLGLESDAGYSVTADGGLSVKQPTVFGIRKAVRIDDDFTVLGEESDEPELADGKIEALFLEEGGQ